MTQRDHIVIELTHSQNTELTKLYERHFGFDRDVDSAGIILGQPDMDNQKAVFSYLSHNEARLVGWLIKLFNWLHGWESLKQYSDPQDSRIFRIVE